ncbi:MAG: hypothetical protein ABT14_19030 [Pelagibacterium sp. SCN 63-17]|nr:MAG: hypothetical protein ABT14_19030 [Pelagibacterium sp. SCN 63-17]
MTGSFSVETVHWTGQHGGAIFTGRATDGRRMRIVANVDAMPRPPRPGEVWGLLGAVVDHPEHGRQLKASSATLERPTGDLIIDFLCGPHCPGIGRVKARALYAEFGDRLYDLLDAGDPFALRPVVGPDLAGPAMRAWNEQALEAATYRWLDAKGLPRKIAAALAAIYGDALPAKADENPYRLMAFLPWRRVEDIARQAGISGEDPRRLVAGVESVVYDELDDGNTAILVADLLAGVRKLLSCDEKCATDALRLAVDDRAVVVIDDMVLGMGAATMEGFVADQVILRLSHSGQLPFTAASGPEEISKELQTFEHQLGYPLNDEQRSAVLAAVRAPLSLLTGGAGTGKTTALRAIHDVCDRHLSTVYQIALAGRAAQKMAKTTGRPAMTIAGFLNQIIDGTIGINALSGALIMIDEASMLDLPLTYRLLSKLPIDARIMLVGDPGQLPPIGFGLVFHVLAAADLPIPRNHLVQVHRQAEATGIPLASEEIRNGTIPTFHDFAGRGTGVSFLDCPDDQIVDLIANLRIQLGQSDTQIICALKGGDSGTVGINRFFHAMADGSSNDQFRVGEPVIWVKNDYDLGLMNGSLGTIKGLGGDQLDADFEGEAKSISLSAAGNIEHAYAITVHKAQGSQFRRVVMPITKNRLLDRTMLYTAVTRSEEQVVLVGDREAFEQAAAAQGISDRRRVGLGAILAKKLRRSSALS